MLATDSFIKDGSDCEKVIHYHFIKHSLLYEIKKKRVLHKKNLKFSDRILGIIEKSSSTHH